MLIAISEGMRVDARRAVKGPTYVCPGCEKAVILHKCLVKADHFQHKSEQACEWSRGETEAHLKAKEYVQAEFERRGIRAETEYIIDTMPGDRRADVMLWTPGGSMVAIELQHTSIDPRNLAERVAAYARVGIRQCWIPFVPDVVWKKGAATKFGWIRQGYSPRTFETWLHRMQGKNGVWMFDRRDSNFWLATLRPHTVYKEHRYYIDSSGEERSSGGYEYISDSKRDLHLTGPHNLESLMVHRLEIRAGRWAGVGWPKMRIAWLQPRPLDDHFPAPTP
jgi:Competence protein